MEFENHLQILSGCFVIALIMGAVAHKVQFCAMGAVSDWVNINDTNRMRSWFLAITVAILGVLVLEGLGLATFDETRPPYRTVNLAWVRYVLGGLIFGVGMTLAGGCSTKNLVRLGGGSLKSLGVVIVIGIFAYLMTKTDFYAIVFHSWMQPLSINLARFDMAGQDLGSVLAGVGLGAADRMRWLAGALLTALLLFVVLRSSEFRHNLDAVLGGLVMGLGVVGGWYLTGGPLGQTWLEAAEWLDERPLGVAVQSYTFVNPMGETLVYLSHGDSLLLTFGVVAVAGVVLGAFVSALVTRRFRIEWFVSWGDFCRHLIGAVLMGVGGVLAMGCTIGQGITGVSTLALGSFMALGAIILGSATTMKVQYYKMLYEEASFLDALISSCADLHLLPQSLRRLEAL